MPSLVEVLSVTLIYADKSWNRGAPSGTISAFDGKRGQIIYRRNQTAAPRHEKPPNPGAHQNEEKAVQLQLTGPYRAISADGCVAIEIDLHHDCKRALSYVALLLGKIQSYVAHILTDVYDDSTEYDVPVTKAVKTCNCDGSPSVEVTYALLSDAVEASVEVKLIRGQDDPSVSCCVHGKIIAHTNLGEIVLFKSNDENTRIQPSQELTLIIPLVRSILAVPLDSSIMIEVDLHIPSTGETVKDAVQCDPNDLDSENPLLHLDGKNGQVDVMVTLSY